jgi:hypothetical protein
MAKQEVKLNRKVYGKVSYPKVVNTEFSQLVQPSTIIDVPDPLTVAEFFQEYNRLFFDIPQNGSSGTHEELVKRSSSYLGVTGQSEEIQALLDEINSLRAQLLSAQQEIINLSLDI